MNNPSVGQKISAGFTLALVSMAAIGLACYISTKQLVDTEDWVTHTHIVLGDLANVLFGLKDAESAGRGYLAAGNQNFRRTYTAAREMVLRKHRDLMHLTQDNPPQQERLQQLEPLLFGKDGYFADIEQAMASRENRPPDASAFAETGRHLRQIRDIIGAMQAEEDRLLDMREKAARSGVRAANYTIAGVTFASIVLLSLVSRVLSRSISAPLREISGVAERIAAGDLAVSVTPQARRDEVGVLLQTFSRMTASLQQTSATARQIAAGDLSVKVQPQSENDVLGVAFATMIQNLRAIIQQILEAVNVMASSSSQIMTTAGQLAAGAREAAAAVSETTATVEEMKHTTSLASQKGKTLSDGARDAAEVAERGRKSVEDNIDGMNRVKQQMKSVAESIVRLSEQNRAIAEIIATVDDLAQQSNLLAVNASIEAAKAGEHGKGFGVVAQEVKTLSEQSKEATTQVRGILTDIRKATGAAVMAAEQGGNAVADGVRKAEAAGESIGALARSAAAAADSAVQIAATGRQQSVGMDQVAQAMENIKQVSERIAAGTEEAQNAAHNLHAVGQKLKALVENFKL